MTADKLPPEVRDRAADEVSDILGDATPGELVDAVVSVVLAAAEPKSLTWEIHESAMNAAAEANRKVNALRAQLQATAGVTAAARKLLKRCDDIDAGTAYNNERYPDRPMEIALSTAEVRDALAKAVKEASGE